jgi:hypothetical protein
MEPQKRRIADARQRIVHLMIIQEINAAAAQPAYTRPSPLRVNHRTASVSRAVT